MIETNDSYKINYNNSSQEQLINVFLWNEIHENPDKTNNSANHFRKDESKSQLKNSPTEKKNLFYTLLDSFSQWKKHHDSWWAYPHEHESYKENKDRNRENQIKPNQTKPNNILK